MLIPQMLYGTRKDVKKRTVKAAKTLSTESSLSTIVEAPGMLDLETVTDSVFFGDASYWSSTVEGFHLLWLPMALFDAGLEGKLSLERQDALFAELLSTPWGTLSLCSREVAQYWLKTTERRLAFLRAFATYQDQFLALGKRFETVGRDTAYLLAHGGGVYYALANLGVDTNSDYVPPAAMPNDPLPQRYLEQAFAYQQ